LKKCFLDELVEMRTIRIKWQQLYEFEDSPAPEKPDPDSIAALVRKRFGYLPKPVTVRIEGDEVVIQHPEEADAAQSEAARLAHVRLREPGRALQATHGSGLSR
jgi:hypothetical protein